MSLPLFSADNFSAFFISGCSRLKDLDSTCWQLQIIVHDIESYRRSNEVYSTISSELRSTSSWGGDVNEGMVGTGESAQPKGASAVEVTVQRRLRNAI